MSIMCPSNLSYIIPDSEFSLVLLFHFLSCFSTSLSTIKQQLPFYKRLAINKLSRANIVVIADSDSTSSLFIDAMPPETHPLRKKTKKLTDVSGMLVVHVKCCCFAVFINQYYAEDVAGISGRWIR